VATLIRIGTTVINLDRVQFMRRARFKSEGISVHLVFDSSQKYLSFSGPEMTALAAYLENEAMDVLAWHARSERGKTEDVALRAAFDANLALLEHCIDEGGHAWKLAPADGHDCIHCGAHCGQSFIDETIACWGGVKARPVS